MGLERERRAWEWELRRGSGTEVIEMGGIRYEKSIPHISARNQKCITISAV